MVFTKTTEYAFRIFAFMALNEKSLYRADELYDHLKIPLRYLKRLLTDLSKTGLMESIQGSRGGFRLTKGAEKITLFDIVQATESNQSQNICFFGFKACQFSKKKCHMHDNWITIVEGIEALLKSTTIADLTDQETRKFIAHNVQLLTKSN